MNNFDVVIAGAGAAGLYGAYNLSRDLKVLVIAKRELTLCNSSLAQGGIAGVYNSPTDSPENHKHDTFVAGGYENDPVTTDVLVNEAHIDIGKLIELGADFDKKEDGDYHRTLEGGHGMHRIFHHADSTGYEIETTLLKNVQQLDNVTIWENTLVCDMVQTPTGFSFLIKRDDDEFITVNSHFAILATGGIGRVYEYTTNSAIATGDGIAMAYRMGAEIKNLCYIQFHPTAFNNRHTRECFLISEAVRGEGAYLRNCNGDRFMQLYDKRLELAPRDVVSHSIIFESQRTGSESFYLDITHKDPDFIRDRFPMIYQNLLEAGFDMTTDMIPIYPCQHYLMGGIKVDEYARTTIDKLYACGECSCTGVHGNNRLASNSLLEAHVFSRRAANDINERVKDAPKAFAPHDFDLHKNAPKIPHGYRTKIRHIMQSTYFVIPNVEGLMDGLEQVTDILTVLDSGDFKIDRDYVEARSLATSAYIILTEAFKICSNSEEIPNMPKFETPD
ncbi:MAG: FAD-binding protein [Ruminococcus sp.]|nr:FAD-binding protein [Ruminococcus sp.]